MSRFAAPAILACPCCESPMLQRRMASIHIYGATYWSDGYTSTICIGCGLDIGVCPSCEGMFWVEDAKQLGILHDEPESTAWPWWKRAIGRFDKADAAIMQRERVWREMPDDWHFTADIGQPRARELLWWLKHGIADTPEREWRLRQKLWWAGNHSDRGYSRQNPMDSEQVRENLMSLLDQADQEIDDAKRGLTQAELLRQLSRFDDALAVLEPFMLADNQAAHLIAERAQNKDAKVCKVGGWSSLD